MTLTRFCDPELTRACTRPGRCGNVCDRQTEPVTRFNPSAGSPDTAMQIAIIKHLATAPARPAPIDMVLHCPACGLQHIDAPDNRHYLPGTAEEWTNPPHRSHLCHGCGHVWRPADVPTNGVQAVKTKGQGDSPLRYVIAARVDRIQDAFTQRLERQRRTGDVKGATATQSAIDLIRSTP